MFTLAKWPRRWPCACWTNPGRVTVLDVPAKVITRWSRTVLPRRPTILSDIVEADISSVIILDDEQVRGVIIWKGGLASNAKPGILITIHSTISDLPTVYLARERTVLGDSRSRCTTGKRWGRRGRIGRHGAWESGVEYRCPDQWRESDHVPQLHGTSRAW